MEEHSNIDILHGSVVKTLIKLSLPILIGMFFELLYNVTDTFFVAQIDKTSTEIISGIGLVFPLFFLVVALAQGVSSGVGTLVAIYVGKKDTRHLNSVAKNGLFLSIVFAVLLWVLSRFFGSFMIDSIAGNNLSAQTLVYAKEYFFWVIPFVFFLFSAQVLFAVLQGKGFTKYIGISMALATLVNIILDPIFIFKFGLGVKGAALATVIAQAFSLTFGLLVFYFKYHKINIHFNVKLSFDMMKEILKLGFPSSLGFVILSFSFIFTNWIVGNIGNTEMNAFTIVNRFDNIFVTPVLAFSIGMSIILGQSFGAKNKHRILETYTKTTTFLFVLVFCLLVLYNIFSRSIFSLFTDVPQVLDLAVKQVLILSSLTSIGFILGLVASFAFQSIAKPLKSLTVTFLRQIVFLIPVAIFAKMISNITILWILIGLGIIIGGFVGFFWCLNDIKKLNISEELKEI
ncbi:MATE family efflux transporter [Candidatus Woesearchaeota archaeon]|nr:MATE family efflux transporter [Candidatus Woesearchaeota archaeon]